MPERRAGIAHRQEISRISRIEGPEVADLLPFDGDDLEPLTLPQCHGSAVASRDEDAGSWLAGVRHLCSSSPHCPKTPAVFTCRVQELTPQPFLPLEPMTDSPFRARRG